MHTERERESERESESESERERERGIIYYSISFKSEGINKAILDLLPA